jgi:hypothetical protein
MEVGDEVCGIGGMVWPQAVVRAPQLDANWRPPLAPPLVAEGPRTVGSVCHLWKVMAVQRRQEAPQDEGPGAELEARRRVGRNERPPLLLPLAAVVANTVGPVHHRSNETIPPSAARRKQHGAQQDEGVELAAEASV